MDTPAYINWLDHIETPAEVSVEKEASFDDVYKQSEWKKKILFRLVKLFGYTPQLAFQKEDVDMKIVEKMLQHQDLLKVIDEWISDTNYELLPKLLEAKKVFERIQKPANHQHLYRGFSLNPGQQDSGVAERYKKMKAGDQWSFIPDKPMSFSWHKGTTTAYGNIVVSAEFSKIGNRSLHITHEMVYAMFKMDDSKWDPADEFYMFTYAESVFLPDGKPVEFTLVSKG